MNTLLQISLPLAGIGQLLIAALNLSLVRLLGWRDDLSRLPLLVREVFHVHAWFISITLAIFGVLTIRFASALTATELGRWLACGIGAFWAVRAVIQVTYYSSSHWRGKTGRTVIHVVLLAVYGGFAATYLAAAFWRV